MDRLSHTYIQYCQVPHFFSVEPVGLFFRRKYSVKGKYRNMFCTNFTNVFLKYVLQIFLNFSLHQKWSCNPEQTWSIKFPIFFPLSHIVSPDYFVDHMGDYEDVLASLETLNLSILKAMDYTKRVSYRLFVIAYVIQVNLHKCRHLPSLALWACGRRTNTFSGSFYLKG